MATLNSVMKENGSWDTLNAKLTAKMQGLLNSNKSSSDMQTELQEDSSKSNLAVKDDGATGVGATPDEQVELANNVGKDDFKILEDTGVATSSPKEGAKVIDITKRIKERIKKTNPITTSGEPKTDEAIQQEASGKAVLQLEKEAMGERKGYDKPVTKEFIQDNVPDSKVMDNISNALMAYADRVCRETEAMKRTKAEAIEKKWTDTPSEYRERTYTDKDGKVVHYKLLLEAVDFGKKINPNKKGTNIDTIKRLVTQSMLNTYGGWDRVTSIVVRDGRLIINNTSFVPVVESKYITEKNFPLDTLNYFKEGKMAYLFDWGSLEQMYNLVSLDIDDVNFYTGVVSQDLGIGRRIGVVTPFRICPKLEFLCLGDKCTTREELYTPESKEIKDKVDVSKRFWNFSDGYKLNVVSATNGIQNWAVQSLSNFAHSRKEHCFFGYWLGLGVGAVGTSAAILANLGVHLAWGVKNLFTASTTPIDESDLGINK